MSWADDLAAGTTIEKEWFEKLSNLFDECYETFGEDSRFDLAIPELDTTIEIKFDKKSLDTGNIVIEYHHNGKPSGVLASEADVWLFATGEEDIWVTKKNLQRMLLLENIRPVMIHGPDDHSPKAVFLIPIETVRAYQTSSLNLKQEKSS